jgi:hypothetical protein
VQELTVAYSDVMRIRAVNATLIRINPRDPRVPNGQIAIAANTLEALKAMVN